MVGTSGGEFGVRGFVAALDPGHRKGTVANLHGACARRTRKRDVAQVAINGRPAAVRSGSPGTTIRKQISRSGEPATAARGWATSGRATTSIRHRRSQSTSRRDRSRVTSNTTRTTPGIGMKCRRRFSWTIRAQRPHDQRPDRRRSRRLSLVPRTLRRPHQICRRQTLRESERLSESRSQDRKTGRRSGPQARHRQDGRLLPWPARRQELASDRIQSADPHDLRPGE